MGDGNVCWEVEVGKHSFDIFGSDKDVPIVYGMPALFTYITVASYIEEATVC